MRLTKRAVRALVPAAVGLGLLGVAAPGHAATPPAAPAGLVAAYSTGAITLTWTDASADETGFVVERCTTATSCGRIAGVGAGVTTFVDTWYAAGNTNAYRVYAVNASGASAPTAIASVGLFSTGQVTARVTTGVTSGQAPLTVSFDGSTSNALNGAIIGHAWDFGDDATATGATASHTYTTPGSYVARLRVTATTQFGTGTDHQSASVLVTVTAPPLPLAAPSDLRASSPARGQVRLTWTNPPSSATSLTLQRCQGRTCTSFTNVAVVTGATSYTDAVKRSTTYRYRLVASNGTATAASNVVTVTSK